MRVVRVVGRHLKQLFRALRALIGAVVGFFAGLVDVLLSHPVAALERLAARVNEFLSRVLAFIARVWRRLWQRAPEPARDSRTTPGRGAVALLAATAAVAVWFLAPISQLLALGEGQAVLGLLGSFLVLVPVFRAVLRREPAGWGTRFLIGTAHRTGLIRVERSATLALAAAGGYLIAIRSGAAGTAALMLSFGFFVLLGSPLRARELPDELPRPILPEPAPTPGEPDGEGTGPVPETVLRAFRWVVPRVRGPEVASMTVAVDLASLERMRAQNPRRPTGGSFPDWTPWVVDGVGDEVAAAAAAIRAVASAAHLTRFDEAAATLAFAQSITYASDADTTGDAEYWRYPIETMHDEHGDCEDLSILAASVLRGLGHDVLPLVTDDHAAIGIAVPPGMPGTYVEHLGRRYYYCETTAEGFRIGELPPDVDPSRLVACPLRT